VAELLEQEGNRCFLVFPGDFRRELGRHWIPPQNPQSMELLLDDIARQARFPIRGVIHLWSCEAAPNPEISVASLDGAQLLGVGSALNLVKAIPKKLAGQPVRLWFITRGAQDAGGRTESIAIEQSPLWGFAGVVSAELGELWGGVMDLDPAALLTDYAAQVFETITAADAEKQIAFRAGARYVPRFVRRRQVRRDTGEIRFRDDASYLITGGLGDLGMEVARWMVRRGAKHLILQGRTELPPRDHWPNVDPESPIAHRIASIEALEKAGADVLLLAADVSSESQMASAMNVFENSGNPAIRGVLHCAAVFDGAILLDLDQNALTAVMRPKGAGCLDSP
jgi:myxalamid-type polyketide synthase MxaE and MxaD